MGSDNRLSESWIMRSRSSHDAVALAAAAMLMAVLAGCGGDQPDYDENPIVIPPGVAGTVSQYADLVGGNDMLVKGYGVVAGLGTHGSSEVPGSLRKYLTKDMLRRGLASPRLNTNLLTPDRMLEDRDTSVVVVGGRIPPGAPKGTTFDLYVECPPRTQTTSLDGGYLLPTDLRFAVPGGMETFAKSQPWGEAKGAVFVNPFAARKAEGSDAQLRVGTIPAGGVVTRERPIRLELRRPDYRMANVLIRSINESFGGQGIGKKIATFKSPSLIELKIPADWREDYRHFLDLLMHVCIVGGPSDQETYAKQLANAITLPTARHEDIALTWEVMGRPVLPVIRELYASSNSAAAFYAARTGLRLGDPMAVEPVVAFAEQAGSPFQLRAIEALGQTQKFIQVIGPLKRLLDSRNEVVRLAAYEALAEFGPGSAIRRYRIADQFELDVVETDRDYVIYATRTGEPRLVLFGNMPIRRPVFYCPPDELVTISDAPKDVEPHEGHGPPKERRPVMVYRRLPVGRRKSPPFYIPATATELVKTLGEAPHLGIDEKPEGLGLSYSQVVGVVQGLCEKGHIPARFVLQRTPDVQRLYANTALERPEMPEQ
jgi:hypothetical protein